MLVKELIANLAKHDMNSEVVVDLIEGFFTIEEHIVEGGTGHPDYQPVVVISLDQKIRDDESITQVDDTLEDQPTSVSVSTVITTISGDEVVVLIDIDEDGLMEVNARGDIKSIFFDSEDSI